jgi:hypothetical protein
MKVSAQLDSSGVLVILRLLETGEALHLRFNKGELKKRVSVDMGGNLTEAFIKLRPVKTDKYEDIDVELSLIIPSFEGESVAILEKVPNKEKSSINLATPPYSNVEEKVEEKIDPFNKEVEKELAPSKEEELVYSEEDQVRIEEEDLAVEKKRRRRR